MNIAAPVIWRSTCLTALETSTSRASSYRPAQFWRGAVAGTKRLQHSGNSSTATLKTTSSFFTLPRQHNSLPHSVQRIWFGPQKSCFSTTIIAPARVTRSTTLKTPVSDGQTDAAGLPLQTPASIRKIFGRSTVDPHKGNRLLRQLQHRRVTGTLDTPTTFSPEDVNHALVWLRRSYPVDEDAAINARLDREDATEAQSYLPQARAAEPGVLEQQRAANAVIRAKEEAEQARRKTERDAKLKYIESPQSKAVAARREANRRWVKKHEERAGGLEKLPDMTYLQRLVPSTIFVATVIMLSLWFADQYIPPLRSMRLFPNIPPSVATVLGIIAINFSVMAAWQFPPFWRLLNRYFILVPAYPYCASILLNAFSHQRFAHFMTNTLFLSIVGTQLCDDIGRGPFVALYLVAGSLSAYISLSVYVARAYWAIASLGASGAISGLITCWFTINLESGITIPFLPHWMTQWLNPFVLMGLMITHDGYGFIRHCMNYKKYMTTPPVFPVDHLTHLGGYAVGIVAGMWMRWTRSEREREGKGAKDEMDVGRLNGILKGVIDRRAAVVEGNKEEGTREKGVQERRNFDKSLD